MKTCKNCGEYYLWNDKFCSSCGQKTNTHRINFHFLIHEIQHGIFHIDSGILFTLKELFTRPGKSIAEYISGKRQPHFKPVLLIMILGALYSFIEHWLYGDAKKSIEISNSKSDIKLQKIIEISQQINHWIDTHYALSVLFIVPLFSLMFYLFFKKYERYNYTEWLVISTFLAGQILAFSIVEKVLYKVVQLEGIMSMILLGLLLWTIRQLFEDKPLIKVILRSILALMLSFFMVFLIAIIVLFAISIYLY